MPPLEKPARRIPGFTISVLLHIGAVAAALSVPTILPPESPERQPPHYSVQLIALDVPLSDPPKARTGASGLPVPSRRAPLSAGTGRKGAPADSPAPAAASAHVFAMPKPVRQTLVRSDVPPDIVLKQDAQLPNLLATFDVKLPSRPTKEFVRPVVRQTKTAAPVVVAAAPDLGGTALVASDLKLVTEMASVPKLPVPQTAPSQQPPAPDANQTVAPQSGSPAAALVQPAPQAVNILSVSENPAKPNQLLVVPPANQIAGDKTASLASGNKPGTAGGNNGPGVTGGSGNAQTGITGAAGKDPAAATGGGKANTSQTGTGQNGTGPAGTPGNGAKSPAGQGSLGQGAGVSEARLGGAPGTGSGSAPVSGGGRGAGPAGLHPPLLPGTQAIALPIDGKFGVVVSGSSPSSPYPEGTGVLSGKVVYTVYLKVGQKKNWILQYCLPKSAVSSSRVEGNPAPVEAPWPYYMVRPNNAGDTEYVLVHGMVTEEGRFDQLAMVFPQEPDGKEQLLQSLKLWSFRPAKRDGEPAAVEVLLIIPHEGQ